MHVVLYMIDHEMLVFFKLFFYIYANYVVFVDFLSFKLNLCWLDLVLIVTLVEPMYSLVVIFSCEIVVLHIPTYRHLTLSGVFAFTEYISWA